MTDTASMPTMSTSEETLLKQCTLAHHFQYVLCYTPDVTNHRLSIGIGAHAGLEAHYRYPDNPEAVQDTIDRWADDWWKQIEAAGQADDDETRVRWVMGRGLVQTMVTGYVQWVQDEGLDDGWDTVAVEQALQVHIPGAKTLLPTKLDLLQQNQNTGQLRIVDHKTCSRLTTNTTRYQLSEQNGNYQLAVYAHYGKRPHGLVYRELRKIVPSARTKPPYFQEVHVRLLAEEMERRAEQYVTASRIRINQHRPLYANPSDCCGSWRNDWQTACLRWHQGQDPLTAIQAGGYTKTDPYRRYKEGP